MCRSVWRRGGLAILVLFLSLGGAFTAGLGGVARAAPTPGMLLSWGYDYSGQLGDGLEVNPESNPVPTAVLPASSGASGYVAIVAADEFSVALKSDGTVYTWGLNDTGQSGNTPPATTTVRKPAVVPGVSGVIAISAESKHVLALKSDGTVMAWGSDAQGILGDGTVGSPANTSTPQAVTGLSDIVAISAGPRHSLAVKSDGTVLGWGSDSNGELGDGTAGSPNANPTPQVVPGLSGVTAVVAGLGFSLALKSDGTVWAWGALTTETTPTPQAVSGMSGITAIDSGFGYAMALKSDGTLLALGSDAAGVFGDGTAGSPSDSPTPVAVPGVSGIVAFSAGNRHVLALKSDGSVLGWGSDQTGQLGDGTVGSPSLNPTPTAVPGLSGVIAVSSGGGHSLAIVPGSVTEYSLELTTAGAGAGTATPAGTTQHGEGEEVLLVATPAAGSVFTGWTVDNVLLSWKPSVTLTMNANHTVVATFAPLPAFGDVPAGATYADPVRQLAARGIIRGCDSSATPPLFCPDDATLRHQMAALIVRAMPGWSEETGLPTFSDNTDDTELMTRVATLQRHNVVKGYPEEACRERGLTPPCYGPLDTVKHGEVLLFIARAMVEKGYWTLQPDDRTVFPDQNGAEGADPNTDQATRDHRHVVTYIHYVGNPPDVANVHAPFLRSGVANGGWADPSDRGWFSRALWPALNNYFASVDLP